MLEYQLVGVFSRRTALEVTFALIALALLWERARPLAPARSVAPEPEFRSLVYTAAFGERFGLPKQGVYPLDAGLEAIALRVDTARRVGTDCSIDLYVDDDVDLAYPSGSAGREEDSSSSGAMFFVQSFTDADLRARLERWEHSAMLFRSVDFSDAKKRGAAEGGQISGYARQILPGLNLVSVGVICPYLDPKLGAAQVWLARRPGRLKISIDAPDPATAYAFTLPLALLQHAANATANATRRASTGRDTNAAHEPKFSLPPAHNP
jgi:hypothetical protein